MLSQCLTSSNSLVQTMWIWNKMQKSWASVQCWTEELQPRLSAWCVVIEETPVSLFIIHADITDLCTLLVTLEVSTPWISSCEYPQLFFHTHTMSWDICSEAVEIRGPETREKWEGWPWKHNSGRRPLIFVIVNLINVSLNAFLIKYSLKIISLWDF